MWKFEDKEQTNLNQKISELLIKKECKQSTIKKVISLKLIFGNTSI